MVSGPSIGDLRRDFGIRATSLSRHEGGFEADAWTVDSTWFVKVWRQEPNVDLGLLERLHGLGLPVAVPLRSAVGGEFVARTKASGRPYAVFPFVPGRTATGEDWRETARALRRVHDVPVDDVGLAVATLEETCIADLRARLDHPWIRDRRDEVAAAADRLEAVIERARARAVRLVVCHNDFGGYNLLLDPDGRTAAILDWDHARAAPREHDVWMAAELGPERGRAFLEEYGAAEAADLDLAHLEYALLARALRDTAARVVGEVDRPGVDEWGFARLARLDADLHSFRPYCVGA